MRSKETVPGPHARTPAHTARGWRTPTAHPEGGRSGEDERLTSDVPHNGAMHPLGDKPLATPAAGSPSQGKQAKGTMPSRRPHSAQRLLARAHAAGLVLGPHAHTTRAREEKDVLV